MKESIANRNYRLATAGIILAASLTYSLGNGRINLWDCDEAWFAQSSRQMVQNGDWVIPRFLDQPRYAKPIFIYWCQALSMKMFDANAMGARLPSVLGVTLTLILLVVAMSRALPARLVMYAILVFSTSIMVVSAGKMCVTDGVLLLFVTGAQLCLYRIYTAKSATPASPLLWICVGLAGLTKGPSVLLVLIATMLALTAFDFRQGFRRAVAWWPATRPLWGLLIVAAIVLPWLLAAFIRDRQFVFNLLLEPVRHAATNRSGGQPAWPGYHLLTIWITLFPWSLFLPAAIAFGWRNRASAPIRFAMATVLGNWICMELMITKLPQYLLPIYSSLALLIASALVDERRGQDKSRLYIAGAILWMLAAIALGLAPWVVTRQLSDSSGTAATVFAALTIAYAFAVFLAVVFRRPVVADLIMGLGLHLLLAVLLAWYIPSASFVRLPEAIGARLRDLGATERDRVALLGIRLYDPESYSTRGYPAPSHAFYQGGTIRERDDDFLLDTEPQDWPRWIVLTSDIYDRLGADRRALLHPIATFHGFNYNIPLGPIDVLILQK
jgi:hypothetical protein